MYTVHKVHHLCYNFSSSCSIARLVSRVTGRFTCPEIFRIASRRISIDQGAVEVNRNLGVGNPESQEAKRQPIPKGPVIFFNNTILLRGHSKQLENVFFKKKQFSSQSKLCCTTILLILIFSIK